MTLSGGTIDANGNYTRFNNAQLSDVTYDIGILQTNYTNAQNALNNGYASYNTALQNLNSAQAALDATLANSGSTTTQIANAKTALQNALNAFTTAASTYESLANTARLRALELINANASFQNLQDTIANSDITNFVQSLSGIVDSQTFAQISSAQSSYQSARSSLNSALSAFQSAEITLANSRYNELQQADALVKQKAQLTINNGLQPSPTPQSSPWYAYVTASNTLATLRATIQTQTTQRDSAQSTLTNRAANYKTSLEDPTNGLITLFKNVYTTESQRVTQYIADMNAAISAVDTLMENTLTTQKNQDVANQQQHAALYPSISSTNQQAILDASNYYGSVLSDFQSQTSLLGTYGIDVTFPQLPGANQTLSMADVMRFILQAQSLTDTSERLNRQSSNNLNLLRMTVWGLMLQKINAELSARYEYLSKITEQDWKYNQQVNQDNTNAYNSQVSDLSFYTSDEITQINNAIDQINQRNAQRDQNNQTITNGVNTTAQDSVNTINTANSFSPNSVNTGDIFNKDQDQQAPTPMPSPTPVLPPEKYPTLDKLPTTFPTPPQPGAPQSEIDAYNAQIKQINDVLAAAKTDLEGLTPPIHTQTLNPLFYETRIPMRGINDIFDFQGAYNALSTLTDSINQSIQNSIAGQDSGNPNSIDARLAILKKPAPQKSATSSSTLGAVQTGESLGMVGAQGDVLSQIITQVMSSQNYGSFMRSLLDSAAFQAAVTSSILPPASQDNYSTMGMPKDAQTLDTQQVTDTQLTATAENLLKLIGDIKTLSQNALLSLADTLPEGVELSADQINALVTKIIFMQQMTLLGQAMILFASSGTSGDTSQIEENLRALAKQLLPKNVADLIDLITQISQNTTLSIDPKKLQELLATLPQLLMPTDASTLQKNRDLIAKQLQDAQFPKEVIQSFQNAVKDGKSLVDALSTAFKETFKDTPPVREAASFKELFKGSNQNQSVIDAFSTALNQAFSSGPMSLTDSQVSTLQSFGVNVDKDSMVALDSLQKLVDISRTFIAKDMQNNFDIAVQNRLQDLKLSQKTQEIFKASLQKGESLGTALVRAFDNTLNTLTDTFNINLGALPENVRSALDAASNKNLSAVPVLSNDQKLAFSLAVAAGIISPDHAKSIIQALSDFDSSAKTLQSIAKLQAVFSQGTPSLGTLIEVRKNTTIPEEVATRIKDSSNKLLIDKQSLGQVDAFIQLFSQALPLQKDMATRLVNLTLDPSQSFLKNFSIMTAQKGPGEKPQLPTQIPV